MNPLCSPLNRGATRARILDLVLRRDVGMYDIECELDLSSDQVQYHLAILRRRGLVAYDGRTGHYVAGAVPDFYLDLSERDRQLYLASIKRAA